MPYIMKATYDKVRAIIFNWPCKSKLNSEQSLVDLQKEFAKLCMSASMTVPVFVLVPKEDYERANFIIPHHVNLIPFDKELKSKNINDFAPLIVRNSLTQELCLLLNDSQQDKDYGSQLLSTFLSNQYSAKIQNIDFNLSNDDFILDNKGLFIGLKHKILNNNSHLTQDALEGQIKQYLGVSKFIWIDMPKIINLRSICDFIADNRILLLHKSHSIKDIVNLLETSCNVNNEPIEIVDIVNDIFNENLSFLQLNENVLINLKGGIEDNETLMVLQQKFAEKNIIGVDSIFLDDEKNNLQEWGLKIH